jgi:hypothetical protein
LELAHSTITGENIHEAILFETETPAAWFLAEQGITRQRNRLTACLDVADFVAKVG